MGVHPSAFHEIGRRLKSRDSWGFTQLEKAQDTLAGSSAPQWMDSVPAAKLSGDFCRWQTNDHPDAYS